MTRASTVPVTVVVVARNARAQLCRTLRELRALPERPAIVVVDDASDDGTAGEVARELPEAELIALEQHTGSVARNAGVERAATPYVAFSDADSWWEPGALAEAARLLERHPRLGLVNGRILVGEERSEDPICREMAASPLPGDGSLPGSPLLSFMAGAAVVRRSAFLEAGGFEPRLVTGGEEELLGCDLAAAGWELRYVPQIVARHHPEGERRGRVRALGIRNALWFSWRRRPLRPALRRTLRLARSVPRTRDSARGFALALAALPWVLRTRRVAPPDVEAGLRLLDAQQMRSEARRYL